MCSCGSPVISMTAAPTISSNDSDVGTTAVWKNAVDDRHICMRPSQNPMRRFNRYSRQLHGIQIVLIMFEAKGFILSDEDMETASHLLRVRILLIRSSSRWEILMLGRLAKIGSMRLALLRAAVIAALTFDSVPDASMISPYLPPSGAVRTTRYRAQPSNWRTISFKP